MFNAEFFLKIIGVGAVIFAVSFVLPRRSSGVFDGHDFVFLWLIGGLAAAPLVNPAVTFAQSTAAMAAVLLCHFGLSRLAVVSRTAGRLIAGKPIVLVENGVVLRKNMRRALVPAWMLTAELRMAGLADVSQVEFAVLETCGKISIIPKAQFWPVTAGDLGVNCPPAASPSLLIEDGQVLEENLARLNYSRQWLKSELAKRGAPDLKDVYLAGIDSDGSICFSYRK